MKSLRDRIWERACKIAEARFKANKKKAKYNKRVSNRQRLYLKRKALGRLK